MRLYQKVNLVGDEKQLPPDNRWLTRDDDDDDDDYEKTVELEVNESILELANKVLKIPEIVPIWHYRSRHNSLIIFQIEIFIIMNLIFPSIKLSEIHLVPVQNPYYHGRKNLPEVGNTVIDTLENNY